MIAVVANRGVQNMADFARESDNEWNVTYANRVVDIIGGPCIAQGEHNQSTPEPTTAKRSRASLARRLRVFNANISYHPSGCWIWQGHVNYKGYGVYLGKSAHRFAYRLFIGPLDPSLVLDHLCRTRACVNPRHVEQVTMRENFMRGVHPGATGICFRGHEMTPENTYIWHCAGKGEQHTCRICRMVSRQRWLDKRKRQRIAREAA